MKINPKDLKKTAGKILVRNELAEELSKTADFIISDMYYEKRAPTREEFEKLYYLAWALLDRHLELSDLQTWRKVPYSALSARANAFTKELLSPAFHNNKPVTANFVYLSLPELLYKYTRFSAPPPAAPKSP